MTSAKGHTIVARPRSLFRFDFDCFDRQDRIVASFQHRAFRAHGSISVAGAEHRVQRIGTGLTVTPAGGRNAQPLVEIRSSGRGVMDVVWGRRTVSIARASIGFRMQLMSERGPIGTLGLRDLFGRTMILDSSEDLPPLVIAALFWLAVARRRQLLMIRPLSTSRPHPG